MNSATTYAPGAAMPNAPSVPEPDEKTLGELQDIVFKQVRSIHRLSECLEQSRLRAMYYRRQATFTAGLLRNIASLRQLLNGFARDWHLGAIAVERAEEGLETLKDFQADLADNINAIRRQLKLSKAFYPEAQNAADGGTVQVMRTWLRDGSTNVMPFEVALDNLVESAQPRRSAEVLRQLLLCGQPVHTDNAVFRLMLPETLHEDDGDFAEE